MTISGRVQIFLSFGPQKSELNVNQSRCVTRANSRLKHIKRVAFLVLTLVVVDVVVTAAGGGGAAVFINH